MTTQTEALKLALEAFGAYLCATDKDEDAKAHSLMAEAFFKIKEVLTQPNQEPVVWMNKHGACMIASFKEVDATGGEYTTPLYTTPPQRTWVGLTDEDDIDWDGTGNLKQLVEAVEAKLMSKNGY